MARPGSRTWHAALFLAFFTVTTAVTALLAGYPEFGLLKDKLLYFEHHKDEYDLVFAGSSRVYRGVIPPRFDAEMAALGLPLRSFNFAVAGMKPHETNALIRRVLAMEPKRLRWIVIELGAWDPDIRKKNRFKRRAVFWHDAPETVAAWNTTWRMEADLATRGDLLLTHALHFAARALAIGRGPDVVANLARRSHVEPPPPELVEWQGFKPYTESSYKYNPMRRHFLKNLDEYHTMVERLKAGTAKPEKSYDIRAIRAQVAMIRDAGVEPVYMITPTPQATPELDALERQGHVGVLLAFNLPQEYPQLYALEQRFDREHLRQEAALELTRLLASRFAAEVARLGD